MHEHLVRHVSQLARYAPPGHSGTVNVRLVEKEFCGAFEMALGRLEPGAEAHRHHHQREHQAVYIAGEAEIALGDDPPRRCGPGTVILIPPHLDHHVVNTGAETLELLVLYSPPLPPRDDQPVG